MGWDDIKQKIKFFRKKDSNDLQNFLSHMPGNFYWKNKGGHYLGCNEGTLKLLGLEQKDFIGKTDYQLWSVEEQKLKDSEKEAIAKQKPITVEITITLDNSEPKILLVTIIPWEKDRETILIGHLNDITDQKRNETELREKYNATALYLEKIVESSPGNIYWKDMNGIYLGCNYNTVRVSNLHSKLEIIGKTDQELWPEYAESIRENDFIVLKTGEALEKEEDVGGRVYLSTKTPLRDEKNTIIGIIGNSIDITVLKEHELKLRKIKEDLEVANKIKTEFLENMRHDIRTPLSGIIGLSAILKTEKDSSKIKKYTSQLAESSEELLRFLNEILESLNVASGEIPILEKKFNLKTVLENVIKLHQPKANEKKLSLESYFDATIPKYIVGDPIRIYRIILELLVNALKFTQDGSVSVSVKLAKKEGRNIVIKIEVEDTGPGVPIEQQQEIFIRFRRLTPSYSGIYQGSGLGLSITKQFIQELQGEIYLENPAKGAKFVCLIPLKESLLDDVLEEALNLSIVPQSLSKPDLRKTNTKEKMTYFTPKQKSHILIVEDHALIANIEKELLEALGCEVEIACDGNTAIELVKTHCYDLIFMDIGLPDIDGFEVTKYIRLHENASQHPVPIIGLTAHANSERKKQGLNVGMNLVLIKPLTEETAITVLQNYILRIQAGEQLIKME